MRRTSIFLAVFVAIAGTAFAEQYVVDAGKNCVFMTQSARVLDRAVKVKLSMNTRYRVSLEGEAFFSNQTGADADPMPGVIIFYATGEQDGFASLYRVLKPGESFRFTTPGEEDHNVFLMAFVMDYWDASANTGKYVLTVDKE